MKDGSSSRSWRSIPIGGAVLAGVLGLSVLAAFRQEHKARLDFGTALSDIEKAIEGKQRPKWLAALRQACGEHDCNCAKHAVGIGLDVDESDAALFLLDRAGACVPNVDLEGLRAEALVRRGENDAGAKRAEAVLARSAANPNALYARALSSYRTGKNPEALALAEASERAGRGSSATLLVGLIAYQVGNFERARRAFGSILKSAPDDVDALFNLAVAAQKEGRYGEARSSYLRVTRLRPSHADARHNLVILTHSVGALDEARHHFETFERLAPNDPRIGALEATLRTPPPLGTALPVGSPPKAQ